MNPQAFPTIDELERTLFEHAYVTDRVLATVLYLTLKLRKPLLLEGEAGVGKTQVAKTLSEVLKAPLIRLQCYEGLDVNSTIYEWNYTRQLLHIRMLEAQSCDITDAGRAGPVWRRVPDQAATAASYRVDRKRHRPRATD